MYDKPVYDDVTTAGCFIEFQYTLSARLITPEPSTSPGTCHISQLNYSCWSAEYRGARLFKYALLFSVIRYVETGAVKLKPESLDVASCRCGSNTVAVFGCQHLHHVPSA